MLSYQGGIRVPSYTASKSAVMGLTRALAELSQYNINVNAIALAIWQPDNTTLHFVLMKRVMLLFCGNIPAGRWGTPEDVAGLPLFFSL